MNVLSYLIQDISVVAFVIDLLLGNPSKYRFPALWSLHDFHDFHYIHLFNSSVVSRLMSVKKTA